MQKEISLKTYKAEIAAHTKNNYNTELISFKLIFPRIVLPEFNTHRMFSKNTSSSRAIPFSKNLNTILENPFVPIAYQKPHKKMQGKEYYTDNEDIKLCEEDWLQGLNSAKNAASNLNDVRKITKQLSNRKLETYTWVSMLMTTSIEGLQNFFELRCPKYQIAEGEPEFKSWNSLCKHYENSDVDYSNFNIEEKLKLNKSYADIHISYLAELMYDSYINSVAKGKRTHIPFEDEIIKEYGNLDINDIIKVSIAKAARFSYTTFDKKLSLEEQFQLYKDLIEQDPPHSSPLEHIGFAMDEGQFHTFKRVVNMHDPFDIINLGWCNNFRGFIQYRFLVDNDRYLSEPRNTIL